MFRLICCVILIFWCAKAARAENAINCVVVMQYSPDTSAEDQKKGIASNEDLLQSAKTLAGSLGAKDTETRPVTSTVKLQTVLDAFVKNKRCCKKIFILGHGSTRGALHMPYELPKADELPERDQSGLGRELGGPAAKTGWGRDRLEEFVKAMKKVSCPGQTPAVNFDACYSSIEGGIAEQVAKQGIDTDGYTGVCDFGYSEDKETKKKEWPGPRPKEGTNSEEKKFHAE
jgi:hypothetical protein